MPSEEPFRASTRGHRQTIGASLLADSAVSVLSQRQGVAPSGARQFILDHLKRAVLSRGDFDPSAMLAELRGHRLSVDAIIDTYVPAMARILGEAWLEDDLDFASVTVGSMRLQSLLSIASVESLDFIRPVDNAVSMLVVIPIGEQHTLGAFVLAAQLRRLGVRVEMSYSEPATELVTRVLGHVPDMILFTASSQATLESVQRLVQDIAQVTPEPPLFVLGGVLVQPDETAKDISGFDLVSCHARDAVALAVERQTNAPEQKGR